MDSVSHGYGPFRIIRHFKKLSLRINWFLHQLKDRRILPILSDFGSNFIVLCQKSRELSTISVKRVNRFPIEQREAFSRKKTWQRKHSRYANLEACELEIDSGRYKSVLVIAPHPDDEMIGCGGTLIKLAESGTNLTILHLTDGSGTAALKNSADEVRKTVRLDEAQEVGRAIGAHEVVLWGETDSALQCSHSTVESMGELLRKCKPDIIFVPFVNDPHPDHVAANDILAGALCLPDLRELRADVLSYEVWSLVPPNCYCRIDELIAQKAELLYMYRTGMKMVDYVRYCRLLNAYHSNTLSGKSGFAEAFFRLEAGKFCDLAQDRESG